MTMPTLKAGISMSRNTEKYSYRFRTASRCAFTFIEVFVALAVVSISLLALLRLHILSIAMADTAEKTSQAVLLANEKIAEKLAQGFPAEGTDSGAVLRNAVSMQWRTDVERLGASQADLIDMPGLRKVSVDVSWNQGISRKHLQMSTYVADGKLK